MRFDAIADKLFSRGFAIMLVCGRDFDQVRIPPSLNARRRYDPVVGQAAIEAVQRGRYVSYVERGISCPRGIHRAGGSPCGIDEAAVHFVLHRRNCLHGAIRMTFHRYEHVAGDGLLCSEIIERADSGLRIEPVVAAVRGREPASQLFTEISGWFVNPDMKQERALGMILPAAVWAYTSLFERPFSGVASLRNSNGAAAMLQRLGAEPIDDAEVFDPAYRGGVKMMTLHSHRFNELIAPLVSAVQTHLMSKDLILTHIEEPDPAP